MPGSLHRAAVAATRRMAQHAAVRTTLLVAGALLLPTPAAFGQSAGTSPPSPCWRFSFGEWTPPLDWSRSGHPGNASTVATAVRRIRDSVFAKDTVASASNAMTWERTPRGALLLLYPPWWPAGVEVTFDSTTAGGTEMLGTAIAMVADAAQSASRSRARAWQVPCSPR